MRDINIETVNTSVIIGKLLDITFAVGKGANGRPYERASGTVRVNNAYPNGQVEIEEIPFSIFASQYTNSGAINKQYENLQKLKAARTVQMVGLENADILRISNSTIQENNFVGRGTNQVVNSWQIRPVFANLTNENLKQCATFTNECIILDIKEEIDRDGDTTGRLIIRGGLIGYQGTMSVVNFIAEDPDIVANISNSWEANQMVKLWGRIRYTSKEVTTSKETSAWGEKLIETSTRSVKELIITGAQPDPYDEDMSYDPVDIKKAFNARKAKLEQMLVNNQSAPKPAPTKKNTASKYDWED